METNNSANKQIRKSMEKLTIGDSKPTKAFTASFVYERDTPQKQFKNSSFKIN